MTAQFYKVLGRNPAKEAEIPSRVAAAEAIVEQLTTDEVVNSIDKWRQLIYSCTDAPDFMPDDLPSWVTPDEYPGDLTSGILAYFIRPSEALAEPAHFDEAYDIVDKLPDFMKPRTVRAITRAGQSPSTHLVGRNTFGLPSAKYAHDIAENVYATEELAELTEVYTRFLRNPDNTQVENLARIVLNPLHAKVEADYRKTPYHSPEHWQGLRNYASAMAQPEGRTNVGLNIANKLARTGLKESGMQSIMDYAQQKQVGRDQLRGQVAKLSRKLRDGTTPQPQTLGDFNQLLMS
jgi:hypothetical protein